MRGGVGIAYNRVPSVLFGNTRGNPPFLARLRHLLRQCDNPICRWADSVYVTGTSNSLTSYPVNPFLVQGIDPATGGIVGRTVEIYGTPQR